MLKRQNIVQNAALKGLPQPGLCVCAVTGARGGNNSLHLRKLPLEHLEVTKFCHTPRTHTNTKYKIRKTGDCLVLKHQN